MIRLIKIEEQKIDDEIACTVRHVEPSSEEPVYSALSYVWGHAEANKEIRLRRDTSEAWEAFALHENLWRFLNFAWKKKHFDRWYWTDFICLDQTSHEEKEYWIPRMGKIYHHAERVVAWLDLEHIGDQLLLARDELKKMGERGRLDESWLLEHEASREAAEDVRKATYWSRIWIMQEVVSAQLVICLVGNMEVDNITLGRMVAFPENHHARTWERLHEDMNYDPCWWAKVGTDAVNIRWSDDERLKKVDLWRLLSLVTRDEYGYTNRQDLIYGILGLAATHPDGTNPVEHIKVDIKRRPVFVIMDALLESYPVRGCDWDSQRYKHAVYLLLREVDIPEVNIQTKKSVFEVLQQYMDDIKTTERHKDLARLLLLSCDAMFSVFAGAALPPEGFCEKDTFCTLLRQVQEHLNKDDRTRYGTSRTWTIQHNAIMLGIALVLETYYEDIDELGRVFGSWEEHRQESALKRKELWRCAVCAPGRRLPKQDQQLSEGELDERWMKLYQESRLRQKDRKARAIYFKVSTSVQGLSPELHDACGCQKACISRKCDGSAMVFELWEAAFRLELRNIRHLESNTGKLEVHIWLLPPLTEADKVLTGESGPSR